MYILHYYIIHWNEGLSRRLFFRPVRKVTIHVSEEFYHFVDSYKVGRVGEPHYRTLDRIMNILTSQDNNREIEELVETVQLLRLDNSHLKDSLLEARRKIREYEHRLGIITKLARYYERSMSTLR